MPLGQLSSYAAFMNTLEPHLPPSPKQSSYLDTLIRIFNAYPLPSDQLDPSPEHPKPTQPSPEHPDATPKFSITPFPPRRPLSSPYLSPILVQAQPTLPHLDLSLELRKLSAFNLRKHALSRSRTTLSKRHTRSYPPSPPLSSSSSSSTYDAAYYDSASATAHDAWFDNIPHHLGLRVPHAQAPRLVLAIFSVSVLALMGQLVLVWMMTREWGVFAS